MALEAASFLAGLVNSNPVGAVDSRRQGDDHIRLLKTVLQSTFPDFDQAQAKMKIDATAAPGVGDDSADGFRPGSLWVDVTNDRAFICLDNTVGAAIWYQVMEANSIASYTAPDMQCLLVYTNATTLTLARFRGLKIHIAGQFRDIPSGGVTVTNGGLVANTLYYIYAYWNGSAIVLEASTTGYVTGPYGLQVKNDGTNARMLVGMAYTNASAQFDDSNLKRNVASFYNRFPRILYGFNSSAWTTISPGTTFAVTGTAVEGLSFQDYDITSMASAYKSNGSGGIPPAGDGGFYVANIINGTPVNFQANHAEANTGQYYESATTRHKATAVGRTTFAVGVQSMSGLVGVTVPAGYGIIIGEVV